MITVVYSVSGKTHLTATEPHLSYEITQCHHPHNTAKCALP